MNRETYDFKGMDNTTAKVKLQKGGYYNPAIREQKCIVVSCRNFGGHIRISDNGFANLVYCGSHAENYLMSELARGDKPRGHWFSVWKGKLNQMYEEKYLAQELIEKILKSNKYQKKYKRLSEYLKV